MTIVVEDIVGSTGLELKVDPGVPYVYAGFAGESWCSSVVCQTCGDYVYCSALFHNLGDMACARLGVIWTAC